MTTTMVSLGTRTSAGLSVRASQAKLPQSETGVALAETALSIALFVFLMLALIDVCLAGFRFVSLQYATNSLTRWASLGEQLQINSGGNVITLTRERSVEYRAVQLAGSYSLSFGGEQFNPAGDMESVTICASTAAGYPDCTLDDAGEAGDLVRLTLLEPVTIIGIPVTLRATALGKLEPFG